MTKRAVRQRYRFDPSRAVGGLHPNNGAGQSGTLHGRATDANSGSLGKENLLHDGDVRLSAEHLNLVGGPVLFSKHRDEVGFFCTGSQKALQGKAQLLTGAVVNLGLELPDVGV